MKFYLNTQTSLKKGKLIYNLSEQSFCFEPFNSSDFTLMLGCAYLGLDILLASMEIQNVSGFCPQHLWKPKRLTPPDNITTGSIRIDTQSKEQSGTGKYLFNTTTIFYDNITNWCCLGPKKNGFPELNIEFAKNCILSLSHNEFCALWLKADFK